ncbi:MAG: maleylpyruvate isomerase family mycothiol-dependent enzyme [Acidimicrobiales bacterium]
MSDNKATIDNIISSFDSFEAVTSGLSEHQWATQSLCPDWTVHGVASHLAAIETVLTGWFPSSDEDVPPFEKASEFMADAAGLSGADLHQTMSEIFAARRAELLALSDSQLDTPSFTPVGVQTYGRFMGVRVFDLWVHEQDIRVPLGLPGNDGGAVAEQAFGQIESSIGYIVGKKIELADGKSIAFELSGPVERSMYVTVDGRAKAVESLNDPSATIAADSLTFALLACGRIDPSEAIDDGRISWTGDAEIGERAARNLRFTM